MKTKIFYLLACVSFLSFTSCSKDDDPEEILPEPSMSNIEIGLGGNGQGTIGRDFHLNADIVAGERIDMVTVDILPRDGEEYARDWSFRIEWDEFKGKQNTTVHKHFNIPGDAPEGIYDFIITVTDENGTSLKEVYDVELIAAANLPVDPYLYLFEFYTDDIYQYVNELLENPEDVSYSQGDVFKSSVTINNVKGNGIMYMLFIKKEFNHLPETVEAIDFSKAIVYDVFQHEDEEDVDSFSNVIFDGNGGFNRDVPEFVIGASVDNNTPEPNPIDGVKAWENGVYYLGMVYTNSTYNSSVYHYLEVEISGF